MGLVGSMGMTDNMMLKSYGKGTFAHRGPQGPAWRWPRRIKKELERRHAQT